MVDVIKDLGLASILLLLGYGIRSKVKLFQKLYIPAAVIGLLLFLARLPMRRILLEKRAYLCVVLRLLAIPALTLLVFRLLPVGDRGVLLTVFLAAATPVGANICVFAQQNNCDYELSVVTVCLSTLLSAVTVPLLVSAAQAFL